MTSINTISPELAEHRLSERDPSHARRWWVLVVLGIAQLMVVLDSTVVNIALPSAQRDLGFGNTDRQWVVTAYALAFGSLLLLGGRLADLFGRKRMFMIGLTGFAAASAVGGAAVNFDMLVTARAVQGVFGALLAPAALSLLTTTFTDSRERGRAFGIYGAIGGGGAAIGLLLGGVLTEYASWRWCMYVNLAFAALALVGGALLLRDRAETVHPKLDIPGIALVSAGLFSVVYGFSHAETAGWLDSITLAFLAVGVVLIVAFVIVQTRVQNPVLPLRVVLDRNRGGSYLAILSLGIGLFGMFLFLTYYLQGTLGFSAVESGLAFLPMTAGLVITSQLAVNVLARRVGPRYIIAPGLAISAIGLIMLANLDMNSSYAANVLPATIIFGLGAGLTFSSATSNATARVKAEDAGVASAMVSTGQQIGGSIGTALLSTLAASAGTSYLTSHHGPRVVELATIHSYTTVFGWSAVVIGLSALVTAVILRGDVPVIDENAVEVPAL
ncbi:MFS transporter [Jatrophihabitans sp.]|uniref:MFS transporter n=1 Tax=Jatrophihabitans sp. TaxID=1932789 RepID=UPI0030C68B8F|nr:drug resistance transporter, EmrB/QacA subfamily [Jatrophihabitans sp.]